MKKKCYQFWAGYYKQGDDLSGHLSIDEKGERRTEQVPDETALRAHAAQMRNAAERIDRLATVVAAGNLKICQADTHFILVECSVEVGDKLVKEDLLALWPDEEEELDGCESDHPDDETCPACADPPASETV